MLANKIELELGNYANQNECTEHRKIHQFELNAQRI